MPTPDDYCGSVRSLVQRELTKDNSWRSYSTKRAYPAYLNRWVIPHWGHMCLSEVKTTQVEFWLRSLPLAKSSCAKIRGILSVLFNHACRHELFDRNPIRLVRQGAKRRSTPSVLTPAEIKALMSGLGLRERTLVLFAASTGLRQSELFGLKWGDINFAQGTMNGFPGLSDHRDAPGHPRRRVAWHLHLSARGRALDTLRRSTLGRAQNR